MTNICRHTILFIVLTAIAVEISNGLVHKIPTQLRKISPEKAKQRLVQKYAKNPQMLQFLARSQPMEVPDDPTTGSHNTTNNTLSFSTPGTYEVANINIGTPQQSFTVELDWYYDTVMEVIDVNAYDRYSDKDRIPHLYNASLSSTYSRVYGDFYDSVSSSSGHRGQDVVNLNGQKFNLTFGILDSPYYYYFSRNEIDGIFGISPSNSKSSANKNMTTTVKQIANQLDNQVVTVWSESSVEGDGSGQITLGALDDDHCESNWIFMPRTDADYYYSGYTVHLATVEGTWTNGTQVTYKANVDLSVVPYYAGIVVDRDWLQLFKNVSNAQWDSDARLYEVDCDTTKSGNITFHVGGRGWGKNSKTYNLTITGADYTAYSEHFDICYLAVDTGVYSGSTYSMPVILGHNFVRNHCLAYNAKNNKIGFADSKTPKTRYADYDD